MLRILTLFCIIVAATAQVNLNKICFAIYIYVNFFVQLEDYTHIFDDSRTTLVLCTKETNVDDDIISNLDDISENDDSKAFVSCLMLKYGMVDSSGSLVTDPILNRLREIGRTREAERYQNCISNGSILRGNQIDTSYALYRCLAGRI